MCALRSGRVEPNYPCSQQDLYTVVETGWVSYAEQLPRFELFSTRYSAAIGTDQLAALELARDLPDEDNRDESHMSLRIQLVAIGERCLMKWLDMSTYIRDGFPANEYRVKRQAAGHRHYAFAERQDWESMKGLMRDGWLFLNANGAALDAGGMTPTFAAEFGILKDEFEAKYQEFLQAEEAAKVQTDVKIAANNELYRNLIKMFEDGKRIFRNEAALREQFTFNRVWEMIDGSGNGSNEAKLNGRVVDSMTLEPIVGVRIELHSAGEAEPIVRLSDADGKYSFLNLRPGFFELKADKVGYAQVINSGTLEAGQSAVYDFVMDPMP